MTHVLEFIVIIQVRITRLLIDQIFNINHRSIETLRVKTIIGNECSSIPLGKTDRSPTFNTTSVFQQGVLLEVSGTDLEALRLHPGAVLVPAETTTRAPLTGTGVVSYVDLEDLLGTTVTLDVELVHKLLTGNEIILAGVDHLLQGVSGTCEVLGEHQSLTGESVCEALGDAVCTLLVGRRLALFQVGNGCQALGGHPLEVLLLRLRSLGTRVLVTVCRGVSHRDRMIDEWRCAPVASEEEVVDGAEHAGLGHSLLHERSSILFAGEVLDNEVGWEDSKVKSLIVIVDSLRCMSEAELIDRAAELVVTIHSTTVVHIVARVVGQHPCRGVDARTHRTTHGVTLELLVSRSQCLLCVIVRLVEGRSGQSGLLGDVELIITSC